MNDLKKIKHSQKPLIIILLLLFLVILISSQIKYRLSSSSKAQLNLPPLPTIDLNPQINLDLPKVNITLPEMPEINLQITPINIGIGGKDDSQFPIQPPVEAPSDIPFKGVENYFIANILPFITYNLAPSVVEIAQGFFAVIGGRGLPPSSGNMPHSPTPVSSSRGITPYPTLNRIPTVLPKSSPTPTNGFVEPTESPIIPTVPTIGVEKVKCSRHITGYVTGCRFGFCLKRDVDETRIPCVLTTDCSTAACLQQARQDAEVEAQKNSASLDWSKSSLSCDVSSGESCN